MEEHEIDRLSSLPDELLIEIISLLPLKSAAATAALSLRWIFLWKEVTAIRLGDNYSSLLSLYMKVHHILKQLSPLKKVLTFELNYNDNLRDGFIIYGLVTKIYSPQMKEIKVNVNFDGCLDELFPFPSFVFQSKSLEVLELRVTHLHLRVPCNGVSLPNLKKLQLFMNESHIKFLNNLIKSAPLLETLKIEGDFDFRDATCIFICAQKLKCLILNLVIKKSINMSGHHTIKLRIVIDAPKLQKFNVWNPFLMRFSLCKTLIDLNKATIFHRDDSSPLNFSVAQHTHGLKLMRSIYFTRSLSLRGDIFDIVVKVDIKDLPIFNRLTELEVVLNSLLCWEGMKRFLNCCPNLEILVLKTTKRFKWEHIMCPSELVFLPTCLRNKIKRITLLEIKGYDDLFGMMTYVSAYREIRNTCKAWNNACEFGDWLDMDNFFSAVEEIIKKFQGGRGQLLCPNFMPN